MPGDAFPFLLTGAPCHAAKWWCSKNLLWLHLSAREVMTRQILQQCWAQHSVLALVGYMLALWLTFIGPIPAAMQQMIDYVLVWAGFYAQQVIKWNLMAKYLSGIPLAEYLYCREYHPRLHLHLGNIPNDRMVIKMTGFNISQLRRLFPKFGLHNFVHVHNETELLIGTNTFHPVTGAKNCYHMNPEVLFLYPLTRIKTDMTQEAIIYHYFGGDYAHGTHGHC
jgi:hypothetical protein